MKKILTMLAMVLLTTAASYAQSAIELARQQRELDKINMDLLKMKPTKEAKKQAKQWKKDGWVVPVGGNDLARQITRSQLMSAELMADENGQAIKRYIIHTATVTSGSESVGYASARSQCQQEIASMLQTKVAAAIQSKADNAQNSAIDATTVDKFHQRAKSIFDATLTMMNPLIHIYRVLPNNKYQVQVTVAYDKKEMKARLKRQLQQQLEEEGDAMGDELNDVVNEVLADDFI